MKRKHEAVREAAQALVDALEGLYWRAQSRANAGHREPMADPVWEGKVRKAEMHLRAVLAGGRVI